MNNAEFLNEDELTSYVIKNYKNLFTPSESLALRLLLTQLKAERTESPNLKNRLSHSIQISSDQRVNEIFLQGYVEGRQSVAKRLLEEHYDEIFINRCAKCSSLCKTPLAQMCVQCGFSWYKKSKNG